MKKMFPNGSSMSLSSKKGLVTIGIRHPNGTGFDLQLFDDDNNLEWFKENFHKAYLEAVAHKPKKECSYLKLVK